MLEKNPARRITLDDMKHFPWVNEGYTVSLGEHGANILANLSNEELKAQGVSKEQMKIAQTVVENIAAQVNEQELKGPIVRLKKRKSLLM